MDSGGGYIYRDTKQGKFGTPQKDFDVQSVSRRHTLHNYVVVKFLSKVIVVLLFCFWYGYVF